ncbi:MAG: cyclic nucleotide-binding protein [Deltaproteobacteria bacterium]|nr:cyclic nucleotide-binding protein [Deltaproteobacteria bacterium]
MARREMPDQLDVAIIGAGPAGLSAAARAAHHKLSYAVFEKGELANTIYEFQKAKLVMAEPRKLPLRSAIPFQEGTREAILAGWQAGAQNADIKLIRTEVRSIKRVGDVFEIKHGSEVTRARHVILSIGVQGTPRKLGAPGEDQPHVVYSLSDPDEFEGKHILVAGAGDSAIENALALSKRNTVAILNRSAEFARAKDANVKLITEAIASGKMKCFASSVLKRIDADKVLLETPEGEVELRCDRVIVRAGGVPSRKFLEGCGIALPADQPAALPKVDHRYQSNVENLFCVGALIGYPLIKQAMNQGYEVIEHILGNAVEPADWVLIKERLGHLPGTVDDNYQLIRKSLPIFADLSEPQFRELLIDSPVHLKQPGEIVFERLDYTDTFWSIVSGTVEAHIGPDKRIPMRAGTFFGELGLMSGRRRSATITAGETCLLVETPRKQMLKLISSVESVKRQLDEAFILRLLPSIFPNTASSIFSELVAKAKLKTFKKGEVLFKEGDAGDALHVIRKGSVKISRKDPSGNDVTRSYMPAGNYLGEIALLSDEVVPRSATVTAVVATETVMIDKPSFRALLAANPDVAAHVQKMAENRRLNDLTIAHNQKEGAVLDFMFSQGVTDASSLLVIDSDLCVACDNCETACAATHDGISRLDRQGGKFFAAVQLPISCRHCENPLCMTDCPPDALTRKPDGEVIIRDVCIGCGNCVSNCPYGVPKLVHEKPTKFDFLAWLGLRKQPEGRAKAAKCDLCSTLPLGPACVRACPTGAAVRINPSELGAMMRRKGGML